MNGYLVWYTDGTTKHFDEAEEVMKNLNNAETITDELYADGKYIGEVDLTVEEFLEMLDYS